MSVQGSSTPAGIYLFKVSNENSRIICEICPKLTTKTSNRHRWRQSQLTFTCSNSAIETLEKDRKYVQS